MESDAQHLSCSVSNLENNDSFLVSFVYAFNSEVPRRSLWSSLLRFKQNYVDGNSSPWVILGDFNVCLNLEEMEGGSVAFTKGVLEFKDFLDEAWLCDLKFTGQLLTWWDSSKSKPIFRKLDRVLVNEDWLNNFSSSRVQFLPRGLSDHCPALVYTGSFTEKIFKPFQFFQHIIAAPNFYNIVREVWNCDVTGNPWFILTSKLKHVKASLKTVNINLGDVHDKVKEAYL